MRQHRISMEPSRVSGLFRKEVYESQASRHIGEELLAIPRGLKWLALASVIVVSAILTAVLFSSYQQTAEGFGWLDYYPEAAALSLQEPGLVVRVVAGEGASVKAGDPILEFSKDRSSKTQGTLGEDLIANLERELQEVERQIQLRDSIQSLGLQKTDQETASLRRELEEMIRTRDLLSKRALMAQDRYDRLMAVVGTGHVSRNMVDQSADELLELQIQERQLSLQIDERRQLSSRTRVDGQARQMADAMENSQLEQRRAALQGQLARVHADRGGVLVAPIPGTLGELSVVAGDSVSQLRNIGRIVPDGADLIAYTLLPARRVGLVRPGGRVRISYESFPSQQFGYYDGKVVEVSSTVISRDIQGQRFPISLDGPAFLVKVALNSKDVSRGEQVVPLRSGITFIATFDLGEKPVFESLLRPFHDWRQRG